MSSKFFAVFWQIETQDFLPKFRFQKKVMHPNSWEKSQKLSWGLSKVMALKSHKLFTYPFLYDFSNNEYAIVTHPLLQ